jgi:hypothetical protein
MGGSAVVRCGEYQLIMSCGNDYLLIEGVFTFLSTLSLRSMELALIPTG